MNRAEFISHLFNEIYFINIKIDKMGKSNKKNLLIQKRNKKLLVLREMTDVNIKKFKYQEETLL
jgi:tmRNA-binding protein